MIVCCSLSCHVVQPDRNSFIRRRAQYSASDDDRLRQLLRQQRVVRGRRSRDDQHRRPDRLLGLRRLVASPVLRFAVRGPPLHRL